MRHDSIRRVSSSSLSSFSVLSPLTYGGSLTVVNIGPALAGGEVFDLFDAPSFSGSFSASSLDLDNCVVRTALGGLPPIRPNGQ